MLKALFIDMNGTLSDDEPLFASIFSQQLGELGITLSEDNFMQHYAGKDTDTLFQMLCDLPHNVPRKLLREVMKRKSQLYIEALYQSGGRVTAETKDCLVQVADAGIDLVLVTSATREETDACINANGLEDLFAYSISGDDVKHPKPHSAPYQRALQLAEIEIEEAIAFEDSLTGLLSAQSCGLFCVGVTLGRQAVFDGFDVVIPSICQAALGTVLSAYSRQ